MFLLSDTGRRKVGRRRDDAAVSGRGKKQKEGLV